MNHHCWVIRKQFGKCSVLLGERLEDIQSFAFKAVSEHKCMATSMSADIYDASRRLRAAQE